MTTLSERQIDGLACVACGRDFEPGSESVPAGLGAHGQLFAHGDCAGSDRSKSDWFDLHCASCGVLMGRSSAPLDAPAQCQPCRTRVSSCASWCPTGDGHEDEMFDADRTCWGRDVVIPLTLEKITHPNQLPTAEVCARRQWGGQDSVYVSLRGGDAALAVEEARQLAAVLLQIADQVDLD